MLLTDHVLLDLGQLVPGLLEPLAQVLLDLVHDQLLPAIVLGLGRGSVLQERVDLGQLRVELVASQDLVGHPNLAQLPLLLVGLLGSRLGNLLLQLLNQLKDKNHIVIRIMFLRCGSSVGKES